MNIIQCTHTQSRCYGEKRKTISPIGIVVHSTGANNAFVKRYSQPSDNDPKRGELLKILGKNAYSNHWNTSSATKSAHYIIGKLADGTVGIVQNLPESIAAWTAGKAGKGSYNYDPVAHIQFEICEDNLKDADYFRAIYKTAVELCADICHRHGWEASVILSHREAHAKGYASNHADIDHWLKKFNRTMSDFRADVAAALEDLATSKEASAEVDKIVHPVDTFVAPDDPFKLFNKEGDLIGHLIPGANCDVLETSDNEIAIFAIVNKK